MAYSNTISEINSPIGEFSFGTLQYSSKGHPKSLGLDIGISVPATWQAKESKRPHIIQTFSKYDADLYIGTNIIVMQDPDFTMQQIWNKDTLQELANNGSIWQLITEETVSKKNIYVSVIETLPCIVANYVTQNARLDNIQYIDTSNLYVYYQGKLIIIMFAISSNNPNKLTEGFKRYKPVRDYIFNSFVLNNIY